MRGRRAVAALAVLATLPLAALACTAAATPAPSVDADSAAPVALQFGPNLAQASRSGVRRDRQVPLVGARSARPLGYRNSPLLTWADGLLFELGGWPKGMGTGHSAAAADLRSGNGALAAYRRRPARGQLRRAATSSAVWTGRYLAVASGNAEPCPGHPAPAPRCWTGLTLYNPAANRWTVLALSQAVRRAPRWDRSSGPDTT